MPTALLLIAHGSRETVANADLFHIAQELRKRNTYPIVEPAFLELATPAIAEGAERCVVQGATQIVLLPYFLSGGVHVRQDLLNHKEELSRRWPTVQFVLAEPLGRSPLLVDLVLQRAKEAN